MKSEFPELFVAEKIRGYCDDLFKNNTDYVYIHIKTEEEAAKVFFILSILNYKWSNGDPYVFDDTRVKELFSSMSYNFILGPKTGTWTKINSSEIVLASEFLDECEELSLSNYTIRDFEIGDLVYLKDLEPYHKIIMIIQIDPFISGVIIKDKDQYLVGSMILYLSMSKIIKIDDLQISLTVKME